MGTRPFETSLKRLASFRDASLRPAMMLRRCHSEQSAASATCLIDISARLAQRTMGCSDMGHTISTRNQKSQPEIFLEGIATDTNTRLPYGMREDEDPKLHLGAWLELLETDVGTAAKIAGCDQSYISNIIAGRKKNVNVLYLLRISEELGVTINDFYRPLPGRSQLNAFKNLSPKAQATILARQSKKG